MTDSSELRALLVASRRGRDAAARSLWSAVSRPLISYAMAVLRDPALAEDAVQNAMLRFMSRPVREVKAVREPIVWLATIVRREAISILRQRSRAERRDRARLQTEPVHSGGDSVGDLGALERAIADLPRREREVVTLHHVAGMTYEQIGVAIDANPNTVASRHRSALRRLQDLMTQRPIPEVESNTSPGVSAREAKV